MRESGREGIEVRRMGRPDIDAVIELDRILGQGKSQISYKDIVALDPGGPLDFSYVAVEKDKIVGFILAHLMYMGMPFYELCVINAIDVRDDYQSKGIGRILVDEVLAKCSTEGINTVRAVFPEKNEKLRKAVENLGFHRSPIVNFDITLES